MHKPKIAIASFAAAMLVGAAPACTKYPDGPNFSLRSPRQRLVREWEVKKTESPQVDEDIDLGFEFEKDGDLKFKFSYTETFGGRTYTYHYNYKGDWEWQDNRQSIDLDLFGAITEYRVLKLTTDELIWEDEEGYKWELNATN